MTEGKKMVVVYEASSGVVFHITPLSLATVKAIQQKAADKFPYPDPAPYQTPDENAFTEGQLSPPEENPAYVKDCAAVDSERRQWADRAMFDYAVSCPDYPTKESLVDAFRPQLEQLREIAVLPKDDYEAVLLHIVLSRNWQERDGRWTTEFVEIVRIAVQSYTLTPAEVADGVRFFRPEIQRA